MREIKFRCWDNKLYKFTYFDLSNSIYNIPADSRDNITQFIGLSDQDGREIYTGDIVRVQYYSDIYINCQVKFLRAKYLFVNVNEAGQYLATWMYHIRSKVVGNIFDGKMVI